MNKPNPNDNPWRAIALVSAVGVDLIVCMTLGFFAGKWISGMLGDNPIWIVVGILTGFAVGVVSVIFVIRTFTEDRHG